MTYAYKNDVLVDSKSLHISLNDYGFCRGYALFELMRCYNGKPFRMKAHIDRLYHGIEALHMPVDLNRKDLEQRMFTLLEKNGFTDSVLKMYITMGTPVKEDFAFSRSKFDPQVYLMNPKFIPVSSMYPYKEKYYTQGISLFLAHTSRVQPDAKTGCYVSAIEQGLREENKDFDDLLYVNAEDLVSECSRANIFFIQNNKVITPKNGALGGITKQVVQDILKNMNIEYIERDISTTEITSMDGSFASGSIAEIMPISRIGTKVFDPKYFELSHKVHKGLKKLSAKECA
jgi:branched-subunit amino acid aminotransferase/4-amino-4-deoxychorismate lyase